MTSGFLRSVEIQSTFSFFLLSCVLSVVVFKTTQALKLTELSLLGSPLPLVLGSSLVAWLS